MTQTWTELPQIEVPTPVLALICAPDGVWAGGYGGVARYSERIGWTPPTAATPIRSVTAIAFGADCLLAGHASGIARSTDGGRSWRAASIATEVATTALALSPRFAEDGVALAATLESGVLRSTDSGRSWKSSSFGLQTQEVIALTWGEGENVLAATSAGIYRSPNGGRAWRAIPQTMELAFAALTTLPDGTILAAPEIGRPLRATPELDTWSPVGNVPDDIRIWAWAEFDDGTLFLSSSNHGIMQSRDDGCTWLEILKSQAMNFATDGKRVFAGTVTGVVSSDDAGNSWTQLSLAPINDYHRLLNFDGALLASGTHSPPVLTGSNGEWNVLDDAPIPMIGLWQTPDGALIGSSPEGLFRCDAAGHLWERVSETSGVSQMTFLDSEGWAGATPDGALLRTRDFGRTWEKQRSPFGNLPLIALQAFPATEPRHSSYLMAATYDDRQHAVTVWRSDDGESWARGADSYSHWPFVATLGDPAVVTVGSVISVQQPDGTWRQSSVGESAFRRVVSDGTTLFALAVDELWQSDDRGASWHSDDSELSTDQLLDIVIDAGILYVLLTGGRVWSTNLRSVAESYGGV
jgi:photosystem II stability/assembly factor-like uncharacterized protein